MAKFFRHAGSVVGLRRDGEEKIAPLPADAADVLTFDDDTNASLIADYLANSNAYSIAGGVLRKNGTPVAVASDGADRQARSDFDAAAAAYLADMQTYLAIADTATNAQVRDQVKRLTQGQIRLVRLALQLRSLLKG